MGNNATVVVRTDAMGDILIDSQVFAQHMNDAINHVAGGGSPTDFQAGWHANPAQVVEVHHADSTVIVAVGGNRGVPLVTIYRWRFKDNRELAMEVIRALREKYEIGEL